jgi:S1-C subfamily serine protease
MSYPPDEFPIPARPPRWRRLARLQSRRARRRMRDLRARARLRSRLRWAGPFALGIVAALIAVSVHGGMNPGAKPLTPQDVNRSIASALASQTPAPAFSEAVYQAVAPSVVVVETNAPGGPAPSASGLPAADPTTSPGTSGTLGSGVIIDTAGDILTCLHVVDGATTIQVMFADGTTSSATVATTDAAHDMAVLQPANLPSGFQPAVLGNPRSVQVGSDIYVIGSPFGLTGSISAGVVSGLDRSFQLPNGTSLTGLIQIDAAVNPGNSGGPLVNRNGQVVGIVDGLINPTSTDVFIGIGLAVPIDVAGGAAGLPPD